MASVYGTPQDVEWAIATDKQLWLLQSRPVTTEIRGVPRGPIYGPGPVAETFPSPLTELENDLWVPPLREAVREAVVLAGSATAADVAASDVVVCVDGHVAIDLRLAGEIKTEDADDQQVEPDPRGSSPARSVEGRAGCARRCPAWPSTCSTAPTLISRRSRQLGELTSRQLIALLHRSQAILRALHAHEILIGMLTDTGGNRMTGASVALRVLAEARQDGLDDKEILARSPAVLALTGPQVAKAPVLPEEAATLYIPTADSCQRCSNNGILREALRLRVRWVQELSGRAAWELGERLTAAGDLPEPELIRHMTLEHVEAVATKRAVVVPALVAGHHHDFGAPLPAWFQLSDLGKPIRTQCASEVGGGTGAGGGSGSGPVTYDTDDPPTGAVLVTTTLSPGSGPCCRGCTASWPRPARCCPISPSWLVRRGCRPSSATPAPPTTFPKAPSSSSTATPGRSPSKARNDVMKIIAWLAGIGTLLAGAIYMVVSLNRWEWNRALFFGLIVLIAEIALATGLVLRRLARLEHIAKRDADPAVVQILSETRPPRRDRFAWMRESTGQFNVFITFLVGGGVILSGIAWLVDRVASKTSSPAGEERLARQLYPISYPSGGLLLDDITVLAQDVPGADDGQIRQLLRRGGRP